MLSGAPPAIRSSITVPRNSHSPSCHQESAGQASWYKYSSAKHAKYQAEVVRGEEREHKQQRAPTYTKLEEALKNLARKEETIFIHF
jgi:hypothetical protein